MKLAECELFPKKDGLTSYGNPRPATGQHEELASALVFHTDWVLDDRFFELLAHAILRTAAPWIASFFSAFRARLASWSGNSCTRVRTGISAAMCRKSSPSWRVLFATLRMLRSWYSRSWSNAGI